MTGGTEKLVLAPLRDLRKDPAEQRPLLLTAVDTMRRMAQRLDARFGALETRITHVRDDIDLMVEGERMGRLGQCETTFDETLDALAARIAVAGAAS